MPYVIRGLTRGKERVSFLCYSVASNSNPKWCRLLLSLFACVVPVPMPIVKKKRKTQANSFFIVKLNIRRGSSREGKVTYSLVVNHLDYPFDIRHPLF